MRLQAACNDSMSRNRALWALLTKSTRCPLAGDGQEVLREGRSSSGISWASDGAREPPNLLGLQEPLFQLNSVPQASVAQSGMPHLRGEGKAPGVLHSVGGQAFEGARDESASASGHASEGAKPAGLFGRLIGPGEAS